jgi:membrane protease YdiL (CAAX protease family)
VGSVPTETRLRGFGSRGVFAILVVFAGAIVGGPLLAAALVLVWARLSGTPFRALGFVRPKSWTLTIAGGAAFGIVFKLVMKAVVMPLLGAPAINAPYHYLAGNTAALPGMIATVLVGAAFAEEVFFRGYLFERLEALLGTSRGALAATLVVSATLFAAAHYGGQGVPGVEQAAVTGLVIGGVYAWRKEIWTPMVIHAAFDLTALALIYRDLEERVAHWIFR